MKREQGKVELRGAERLATRFTWVCLCVSEIIAPDILPEPKHDIMVETLFVLRVFISVSCTVGRITRGTPMRQVLTMNDDDTNAKCH